MKTFSFRYDEYNDSTGVLYETNEKMIVKFSMCEDGCILSANKEGLISLAKSLIKLADQDVPIGMHYHLNSPIFFEIGSLGLIVEKI